MCTQLYSESSKGKNFGLDHRNRVYYLVCVYASPWFGHINRMPATSTVKKIYRWKPFTRRPVGRPKSRWEDDVRNDLKKM